MRKFPDVPRHALLAVLLSCVLGTTPDSRAQDAAASPASAKDVLPVLTTRHLAVLSDTRGISEFARGTTPIRNRFCIEDTARALVAVLKIHALAPTDDTARLARLHLDAIAGLQGPDGRLRFGYQGDEPMERLAGGDQFGRTLWGLGHASIHGIDGAMRTRAQAMFGKALPHLKTTSGGAIELSYALQGLHLFLRASPDAKDAARALRACADRVLARLPRDRAQAWQWPSDLVTYDSARLPLALLLASEITGEARYREAGLRVLEFLATVNFPGDGATLHTVGNRGWFRRGHAPAEFAQQPIDASSMVEACAAAWRTTRKESWRTRANTAFAWFLGNNTGRVALYDPDSGGCRDGLGPNRPNPNQGAESTASFWIARCEIEPLTGPRDPHAEPSISPR